MNLLKSCRIRLLGDTRARPLVPSPMNDSENLSEHGSHALGAGNPVLPIIFIILK